MEPTLLDWSAHGVSLRIGVKSIHEGDYLELTVDHTFVQDDVDEHVQIGLNLTELCEFIGVLMSYVDTLRDGEDLWTT